jgi:hypothetical protein
MVVGEETPDEGAVSVPKKLTIGYFRQDVEEMQGRSVLDEAIAGSEENRGRPRSFTPPPPTLRFRNGPVLHYVQISRMTIVKTPTTSNCAIKCRIRSALTQAEAAIAVATSLHRLCTGRANHPNYHWPHLGEGSHLEC